MRNDTENKKAQDVDSIENLPERPSEPVTEEQVKGGIIIIGGMPAFRPAAYLS